MKKLKLEIEELRVESFEAGSADGRGTIAGRNWTAESCDPCEPFPVDDGTVNYCQSQAPENTCGATYCGTCGATCSCGCWNTRAGWTCDPYASECLPVPEENPPI
jgi:hypothetical protein